jgi:hypothetical protein
LTARVRLGVPSDGGCLIADRNAGATPTRMARASCFNGLGEALPPADVRCG